MEIFTKNLKNLLQIRKMTHKELRELTGIKTASMSRYANGQTCPSARDLYSMARALGVSMDFLWTGSEFPKMETSCTMPDSVHDNDAVADAFAVILDAVEKRRLSRRNAAQQ